MDHNVHRQARMGSSVLINCAWYYGRHYARPGLDLRTRQLCTIAALTVLGGQTAPQLKINIEHTLAAGASREEIVEAIWQMAVYGGLPAAINGINAAREVFAALDPDAGEPAPAMNGARPSTAP